MTLDELGAELARLAAAGLAEAAAGAGLDRVGRRELLRGLLLGGCGRSFATQVFKNKINKKKLKRGGWGGLGGGLATTYLRLVRLSLKIHTGAAF